MVAYELCTCAPRASACVCAFVRCFVSYALVSAAAAADALRLRCHLLCHCHCCCFRLRLSGVCWRKRCCSGKTGLRHFRGGHLITVAAAARQQRRQHPTTMLSSSTRRYCSVHRCTPHQLPQLVRQTRQPSMAVLLQLGEQQQGQQQQEGLEVEVQQHAASALLCCCTVLGSRWVSQQVLLSL